MNIVQKHVSKNQRLYMYTMWKHVSKNQYLYMYIE